MESLPPRGQEWELSRHEAYQDRLAARPVGEDVLITGAGPIGIMGAAVAAHAGARYTVITDVNPYRLDLARKMGVTRAVDVRETKLADGAFGRSRPAASTSRR